MAKHDKKRDDEYKLIQSALQDTIVVADPLFPSEIGNNDVTSWEALHQPQTPFGLTPKLYGELRKIEGADFAPEVYGKFSMQSRHIMARRVAARNDPALMVQWLEPGMTLRGIALVMGFGSWTELIQWARRNDRVFGGTLEDSLSGLREIVADMYADKALELVEGIGSVTGVTGRTESLISLAEDHAAAIADSDDATAFRLAQRLPLLKAAAEMDATRRMKTADMMMRRAAALAPHVYNPATRSGPVGAVQHVSIRMDIAPTGAAAAPKQVNGGTSAAPSGITLDMGQP